MKTQIADEYIESVIKRSKENYKTGKDHLGEMYELIGRVKEQEETSDDLKRRLACAVDDAWHMVLWVDKTEFATRFINTIKSYVGGIAL